MRNMVDRLLLRWTMRKLSALPKGYFVCRRIPIDGESKKMTS